MTTKTELIYEVTLSVDREVAGDIDGWLIAHIDEMLLIPGFTGAKVFSLDEEQDRVQRTTHYYLENDAALERYLAGPATVMRQATVDKYAGRFDASRRILREMDTADVGASDAEACLNCDAILAGQYCGNCGQRASSRLISVWELLRDAFGDLLELDSRIWQTLIPLAVRPGQLTRDYLRGRRARFMPPFRTYLVLSLLFFLVAFFDPQETLGILFEPEAADSKEQVEEIEAAREELRRELAEDGILIGPGPADAVEADAEAEPASGPRVALSFAEDGTGENCDLDDFDSDDMPAWLARRLTKERLQVMCDRMTAEDGKGFKGFIDKMMENVPAGLFVLLPLMALMLNLLYPLSKRYYVEHLLFVVHYHAFFFLALIVQILWSRITTLIGFPEFITDIIVFILAIYIAVYLYKAMRRVYEQGRFVTGLKFLLLLLAYAVGLAFILAFAAIFAAFSI